MDWKQIESKWAAMTLRISSDAQCGELNDAVGSERRIGKDEATKNVVAKQISVVNAEIAQKPYSVSTR